MGAGVSSRKQHANKIEEAQTVGITQAKQGGATHGGSCQRHYSDRVFLSEEGRSKSHHFSQDGKSLVNIIREQPPTVNAIRLLGDLLSQAQLIPQETAGIKYVIAVLGAPNNLTQTPESLQNREGWNSAYGSPFQVRKHMSLKAVAITTYASCAMETMSKSAANLHGDNSHLMSSHGKPLVEEKVFAKVTQVLQALDQLSWSLTLLQIGTQGHELQLVGLWVLLRANLHKTLRCDEVTLKRWLEHVSLGYESKNKFYTALRVTQVVQMVHYFLGMCTQQVTSIPLNLMSHLNITNSWCTNI
mmetsp:Transcript_45866/g.67269  ORF Transcript_45866/g.67269 Transcript_45866/m.67269 type:complete len:301 (+) Transcript_45866:107-1009(+)|eukprot:CAMPEP_0173067412 /NCGR_PEP_ID=MMETSP1102-20130122/6796_1 /TAXON_ID=49646 /ORGANISM="Geminigera sp., Strain Caron Lab Isolate" /LENGTH=300 /DNA_ID=CAMNT_0013935065 /DNA_START=100 /DNA_END=1002 /DNA_ORIENTATION=+